MAIRGLNFLTHTLINFYSYTFLFDLDNLGRVIQLGKIGMKVILSYTTITTKSR